MKKLFKLSSLQLLGLLAACGTEKAIIPHSTNLPSVEDNYTIVWVGSGTSYKYSEGEYVRSESNDYSFEVVQRRYDNSWKSIKNMHRIHPDYDGKAGAREQTMFFAINFSEQDGKITSSINSSLGNGSGVSDEEFREQTIQFGVEGISSFAPYNTMRITQHYKYEEGLLLETVELFKLKDGVETPFAKIEERAHIFGAKTIDGAPTKFKK